MRPIAKFVKRQVRSTDSSHIVKTTIRLSHNAVMGNVLNLDMGPLSSSVLADGSDAWRLLVDICSISSLVFPEWPDLAIACLGHCWDTSEAIESSLGAFKSKRVLKCNGWFKSYCNGKEWFTNSWILSSDWVPSGRDCYQGGCPV